jgi:hypothetical protein
MRRALRGVVRAEQPRGKSRSEFGSVRHQFEKAYQESISKTLKSPLRKS